MPEKRKKTWVSGPKTPSAKRKSLLEEENAKIARFATETRNLVLWKDPIVEIQTRTGFRTDEKSGYAIEFVDWKFETKKLEDIEWLINHDGFRDGTFHPVPVPGDWWEANGFFKKDSREFLSRTTRQKILKKEGDKVIEGLSQELAKTVGTITSSTEEK